MFKSRSLNCKSVHRCAAATAGAVLLCGVAAWPAHVSAQTWNNPATGDWFTAGNWNPAAVPVAGGAVIVSNGGTATLSGLPATPVLGSLSIGLTGAGTGVGTVSSNGVAVNAGAALNIGTTTSTGASANGRLQIIGGAGGSANNVTAGFAASALPATATGRLDAAGSFVVNGGNLVAGQSFGAARGSVASGVVNIGGNAGTVNFLVVGDVFSFNDDQVGSRATGTATIGGNMALTGFASVGTAFSPAGVADATAPGGFRVNQASGTVNIGGTLSIANTANALFVGTTGGGVADGAMSVGTLNLAAGHAVTLAVGNSAPRGQAIGSLTASSGDLRTNLQVDIGTAVAGTAQGRVTLGGRLLGNDSGLLRVGTVLNPAATIPGSSAFQGIGSVSAAGGIAGYTGYDIAAITGPQAAGSRVEGRVIGGTGAPTSILLAGYTSADGFAAPDRVADAAAPGGFRVNQASGTIKIGGTLSVANTANSFLIGTTGGGIVDGSVRVGSIAMAGNPLPRVEVGVSGAQGQATGALDINGGTLRADTVRLGVTTGGSAAGRLALNNANLEANTVRAGTGGGTAMLLLRDSQASVAQDMTLTAGLLGLERSRLRVGNNLTFGNDALTHVEIDGLTRGTQYGTIDALAAMLDGRIEFDFGDFLFGGAAAVFDILRSGGMNGIAGDFDAFSFVNLAPHYTATAGIELDSGVEVYRVRLARINAVPVPASALLLLLGLGVLAGARGRKQELSVTDRMVA